MVAGLALTGCGKDPGESACEEFAAGFTRALTADERESLAATIAGQIDGAPPRVAEASAALTRAEGNEDAWIVAADAFSEACAEAGWST